MGMTSEDKIHALKLIKLKIEPPTDNRLGWLETWIHKEDLEAFDSAIKALEQEPKTGHCKACKWWKDSDGVYRRGVGAESKCPINRNKVYEGNGYCYMFEPQESEVEDGNN